MSALAERIARSIPSAGFELEALVRLIGIEETDRIPTAMVTTRGRSRMLVNPAFVDEFCQRDEHLYLLVMHELWHVLLGHTTLYRRSSVVANIAFDALINAGLSRQHPEPAYRGFFEATNSGDRFPHLLLRPPVGWPDNPVYPRVGPAWVPDILERLYPRGNRSTFEPTNDELIELLEENIDEFPASLLASVTLLGDHGPGDGHPHDGFGSDPLSDPLLGAVLRDMSASWPAPPSSLQGARGRRGPGGPGTNVWVARRKMGRDPRRVFAAALSRALEPNRAGVVETRRSLERVTVGPGPLPNATDRTLVARRRLIGPGVLANQTVSVPRARPEVPQRALVYLDVSGSMEEHLPGLVDLLVTPARQGRITVRQFSTEIAPISAAELAAGELTTTGGTSIDCVLDDALARPERRILIVTDGMVGRPRPEQLDVMAARGVRVIALVPEDECPYMIDDWCEVIDLPTPYGMDEEEAE